MANGSYQQSAGEPALYPPSSSNMNARRNSRLRAYIRTPEHRYDSLYKAAKAFNTLALTWTNGARDGLLLQKLFSLSNRVWKAHRGVLSYWAYEQHAPHYAPVAFLFKCHDVLMTNVTMLSGGFTWRLRTRCLPLCHDLRNYDSDKQTRLKEYVKKANTKSENKRDRQNYKRKEKKGGKETVTNKSVEER